MTERNVDPVEVVRCGYDALSLRYRADDTPAGNYEPWIAEVDGARAGCVFCVASDGDTAKLRILLVDPAARGQHIGRRLVDKCVAFARSAGYRRMVLWTNDPLVSAAHIYLAAGFRLTAEESHHSFGVHLIGQSYELDLTGQSPPGP